MRVVLDTNILISALLVQAGTPGAIYRAWTEGGFTLLSCQTQMEELRNTLRKPSLVELIQPHHAGHMVNELNALEVMVDPLPRGSYAPPIQTMIFCWPPPRAARQIILSLATKAAFWPWSATKEHGS